MFILNTNNIIFLCSENTPQDDDEDAFDVKNLMNKFKNIGNEEGKKIDTETRAELEALKSGVSFLKIISVSKYNESRIMILFEGKGCEESIREGR